MEQQIIDLLKYGGSLGGVVIILYFIDRMLKTLGVRRPNGNGKTVGEMTIAEWEARSAAIMSAAMSAAITPILLEIRDTNKRTAEHMERISVAQTILLDRDTRTRAASA